MDLPENCLLPLFAYGAFRHGEIAYLRLKEYVVNVVKKCTCPGKLHIRDGFALLNRNHVGAVEGDLIDFKPEAAGRAYYRIIELEPDKQYQWGTIQVQGPSGVKEANVLEGLLLNNGSHESDRPFYGKDDPLFKESFVLIKEALEKYSTKQSPNEPNPNYANLLHLQMAYMLLWSSIERYATLRYGFGKDATAKVHKIAKDDYFCLKLRSRVNRTDRLFPTNDPATDKAVRLNKEKPKESLSYYYQVRCNITHRGKSAFDDFDRLKNSLEELTDIFQFTLENAFIESSR